jgi:RimJ/RimL family protein N-acetyltransferase
MSTINGNGNRFQVESHSYQVGRTAKADPIDFGRPFRGITLRQVADRDMPFLFRLFADPERCHLWMRGRRVYDEAGFTQAWAAWTSDEIAAKFIVESVGRPVGLVFDYSRNVEDGLTRATSLLTTENVGRGAGITGSGLFMDWLFQALPFRKIYHEVFSYNPSVVRIWRKLGLTEEGIFKADRFWNGDYWDLHVFALYRETWHAIRPRVLRRLGGALRQHPNKVNGRGKEVGAKNN